MTDDTAWRSTLCFALRVRFVCPRALVSCPERRGCIPVFTIPLTYLPFGALVPWADLSLSVDPLAVFAFCKETKEHDIQVEKLSLEIKKGLKMDRAAVPVGNQVQERHANNASALERALERLKQWRPLLNPLQFLESIPVSRIVRMQRGLLKYRHLLYYAAHDDLNMNGPLASPTMDHSSAIHAIVLELVGRVLGITPLEVLNLIK